MSGLKAIVKQVGNRWSRSSRVDTPLRADYTSSLPPVVDQSQNTSKPETGTRQEQPVAGPVKLKYEDKIPKEYVPREQTQERLREQLRQKMQPLDEALAARQEAAALERAKAATLERAKEVAALPKTEEVNKGRETIKTWPNGEVTYKGAPSLSRGAHIHPGERAPPPQSHTPSVDAGVPPLPSPADAYQTAQVFSVRSIKAHEIRKVDIPQSKQSETQRLTRTPSASTINSTTSSVLSTTSKSSVSTSASSVAAREADIPPSKRPDDAMARPSPTDLGRAEDHQKTSQRPPLDPRVRPKGLGR
jgi:hypothetical protein